MLWGWRGEGVPACAPKKKGVISEKKAKKIRKNSQKIEKKLFEGKNGSHTC